MPYAHASDGTQLYYEERGSGEPLLLISGQGSDHNSWGKLLNDFAAHYRVIVFDHRGTGQSDKPTQPPYTTRGFAQDAIAILNELGIARAHAYGISMGGRICQWLGIEHAERIGALVLGCTTPGNAHGVARPAEVNEWMVHPSPETEQKLIEEMFSPTFIQTHAAYLQAMEQWEPIPAHAQRLHYRASEGHDTWDLLPTISVPTLVIHGSQDRVNPTANAYLLAERIPNAELVIIEGGRHIFHIEFREEAFQAVNAFLARHPLG